MSDAAIEDAQRLSNERNAADDVHASAAIAQVKPNERMPPPRDAQKPVFFASASEFRSWLRANATQASELLVGLRKIRTGKPSITWPESVDEALCVGWIDGVRKRIDDTAYCIRFTPRRPGSIWSAVNVARVSELIAQNRMQPAGLEAFARRTERKTSVYAYEQKGELTLTAAELRLFKKNRVAWQYFERAASSYRKVMIYWIVSAKKPETRERRLRQLIEASASGQRLLK